MYSRYLPELHFIWSQWYISNPTNKPKYIKVLPTTELNAYFNDYSLAYWFMNDGYWDNSGKVFMLCTDSFSKQEVSFLVNLLLEKFGIQATLRKRITSTGLKCNRIRISRKSTSKFIFLVQPHVISAYQYKLLAATKN